MTIDAANFVAPALAQSLGNDPNAKYILIGAVALVILYVVFRPFLQKKKKDPLDRPPPTARLSQQRTAERQMETLLVELNEMARRMSAQLDTRSAKLEAIIKDADGRIAELRDLLDAARTAGSAASAASFDAGASHGPADPVQPGCATSDVIDIDPTHAKVHHLADDGKTVGEIAHALDRPSGEVELILALRPRAARGR
ncbi:MAG TPA: hypothetical protein VF624_05765 [Tepidisphaeraceae bacterium]|jgi:cell division septation protein DedD